MAAPLPNASLDDVDDIDIVPLDASLADAFHACLCEVASEKPPVLGRMQGPPLEEIRDFARRVAEHGWAAFVAVADGRVVGWCDCCPQASFAIRHRGTIGMGVRASHRRRGLGRRLLSTCIAKARGNGLSRIELEVRADNVSAIALYRAVGFHHEAVKARGLRYDGPFVDSIAMSLVFEDDATRGPR